MFSTIALISGYHITAWSSLDGRFLPLTPNSMEVNLRESDSCSTMRFELQPLEIDYDF